MTLLAGKVFADADAALADLADGASLACGGFAGAGAPLALMQAVVRGTATGLAIIANNGAISEWSMAPLLEQGRVRRVVATHIGGNRDLQRSFLAGEVEIELTPQGTFAEGLRAGTASPRSSRRPEPAPSSRPAGAPSATGLTARSSGGAGPEKCASSSRPASPSPTTSISPGCSWIVSSR